MKRSAEAKVTHFYPELPSLNLQLHFRNDLHLARKAWHIGMGLVIAFCYLALLSQSTSLIILSCVLGLDLFLESSRLRSSVLNEKLLKFWGPLLRRHEVSRMSTAPHYLASVILAIAIFPKPVAILSILYLACGDPIASLFGILFGHLGPRFKSGKSLVGTLAGILTCFLVSLIYLHSLSISTSAILGISILGGIAGGMAELLPFDIDDNFSIPIISGFVLWLAFLVIGL